MMLGHSETCKPSCAVVLLFSGTLFPFSFGGCPTKTNDTPRFFGAHCLPGWLANWDTVHALNFGFYDAIWLRLEICVFCDLR